MKMTMMAVAAMLIVPTIAFAQDAGPAAPDKAKKPAKICRSVDRPNSHIAERVCRTAEEWKQASVTPIEEGMGYPGNRTATGRNVNVGGKGPTL